MRFLVIARHCEAVPTPPGAHDSDRALSEHGQVQARALREWYSHTPYVAQTALVSSARRTRETYALAFDHDDCYVEFSELIYNGRRDVTAEDVLIDLVALDPVRGNLLVVGHNPTLSDLLLTLCPDVPASLRQGLPTGGVAVMALRVNEPLGLVHYDCVDVALADELL